MKKKISAVVVVLILGLLGMGAGYATFAFPIKNFAVHEPLRVSGELTQVGEGVLYPGQTVARGEFVVSNTAPVKYCLIPIIEPMDGPALRITTTAGGVSYTTWQCVPIGQNQRVALQVTVSVDHGSQPGTMEGAIFRIDRRAPLTETAEELG